MCANKTHLRRVFRLFRAKISWQVIRLAVGFQVLKKRRSDSEQIAASESFDLTNISERCAHDLCRISMLFVVMKNVADRDDTWIFCRRSVLCKVSLFHVPVKNSPDKGRDKGHSCFCTGNGLCKTNKSF